MPNLVCSGALLKCSFGDAPSSLNVLPINQVNTSQKPAAVITSNVPMENISPFGMCSSMANPEVASATAAAEGVLTPMPCIPATAAPWSPGSTKVKIKEMPVVTKSCQLACSFGGMITVEEPGQVSVTTE